MGVDVQASSSGPGNGPTVHSVLLTWAESGTPSGNCIYRSTTSGGPYGTAIFVSNVPITTWTDTTVANGTTYYYVVTEYNSGPPLEESAYSNQTTAVVPQSPSAPSGLTAVAQ